MVSIGGKVYQGNVSIINGQVFVNGRPAEDGGAGRVSGNNLVTEEHRDLGDRFQRIQASGLDNLNVVCGSGKRGLDLKGESNILPQLESRVDADGTLHIGFKPGSYSPNSPVQGTLFMDEPLRDLELSGSVASQVENVDSRKLSIDLSGSSSAVVKGRTEQLDVDVSGSARFDGQWLVAGDASVDASGASKVRVRASNELEVDASGAAKVSYSGAQRLDKSVSGAASVQNEETGESFRPEHGGSGTVHFGGTVVGGNIVIDGDFVGGSIISVGNISGRNIRLG